MVNWKTAESTDRLIAALIAANPGIKLEYQAMATLFGQGATYDAIEGRFRRYRKMADELRSHALSQGITELPRGRNGTVSISKSTSASTSASTSSTPRTPRGPRGGITKATSGSASSARSRMSGVRNVLGSGTPSKRGEARGGLSLMDAIFVDVEAEAEDDVKVEVGVDLDLDLDMKEGDKEVVEILPGSGSGSGSGPGFGFGIGIGMGGRGGMQGRERGRGRMQAQTHAHAQGISMKFEGEGFVHGGAVEVADLEQNAFDMTGLSFLHGQGAYTMDNIYGGVA